MVRYPADSRYSLTNHHHGGTDNHCQFSYVGRKRQMKYFKQVTLNTCNPNLIKALIGYLHS